MPTQLSEFETALGYNFVSIEILERAFADRSWANEQAAKDSGKAEELDNERLEFVGDSVIGLIVAEELYRQNPETDESGLSLMKHSLVRMDALAAVAERLKIGDHVRLSAGEEKIGGRRNPAILADAFEAVVAAIFLDGGYDAARSFVTRAMANEIKSATPKAALDYKTLLQETLQANKMAAPTYEMVRSEGQPHNRTFFVEAVWQSGRAAGTGRSIKAAEMMAANNALEMLGIENGSS